MEVLNHVPEDYNSLLEEFRQKEKLLEEREQKIFDLKRQLGDAVFLQNEYAQEIEALQGDKKNGELLFKQKTAQIEETFQQEKLDFKERINSLEELLANLRAEMERKEVKSAPIEAPTTTHDDTLMEKVENLEEEIEDLRFKNDELLISVEETKLEKINLQEQITNLNNDLREVREMLNCKRDEVVEKDDLIQTLNDELACVKTELEMHKSKPLDQGSQGNSLFSEVDDRRVYLENKIESMKENYLTMERERASLLQRISMLQSEKIVLSKNFTEAMDEQEKDEIVLRTSLEERIETLEKLLQNAEAKLKEKDIRLNCNTFENVSVFEKMYKEKEKEIENLSRDLSTNSVKRYVISQSLMEADKEKQQWKFQATQYKTTNDLLLGKLKDFGCEYKDGAFVEVKPKKVEEKVKEQPEIEDKENHLNAVKSILKESNSDEKIETESSGKATKRIAFDESTIEPSVNARISTRRCKVIYCPPKKFISSKVEK